jgi:hypothetical protein
MMNDISREVLTNPNKCAIMAMPRHGKEPMKELLIKWISEADDATVRHLFGIVKGFLHK